jgi:hypothetical protein
MKIIQDVYFYIIIVVNIINIQVWVFWSFPFFFMIARFSLSSKFQYIFFVQMYNSLNVLEFIQVFFSIKNPAECIILNSINYVTLHAP